MVEIIKYPKKEQWKDLCKRPVKENSSLQQIVTEIVQKVKAEGDEALRFYSQKFDATPLSEFAVSQEEINSSEEKIKPQVREILTKYGDLCLIWFDVPYTINPEQSLELNRLVKEYQPESSIDWRHHLWYTYTNINQNGSLYKE